MYANLIGSIAGLPKQEQERILAHKGKVYYFE